MLTKLLLVTIVVLGDNNNDNGFTYPRGVLPCHGVNKLGHDQKHGSFSGQARVIVLAAAPPRQRANQL